VTPVRRPARRRDQLLGLALTGALAFLLNFALPLAFLPVARLFVAAVFVVCHPSEYTT